MEKKVRVLKKGDMITELIKDIELNITGIFEKVIDLNWKPGCGLALVAKNKIMAPYHIQVDPFVEALDPERDRVWIKDKKLYIAEKFVIDLQEGKRWSGKLKDYHLLSPGSNQIHSRVEQMVDYLRKMPDKTGLARLIYYWPYFLSQKRKEEIKDENIINRKVYQILKEFWREDNFARLSSLIGLGIGLTPSADDFLVGFLSVLYYYQSPELAKIDKLTGEKNYSRTTPVSAVALRAALRGSFNEKIVNLYLSLDKGRDQLTKALDKMRTTGSTSGLDMLSGIIFGFLYTLHNK